MCDTFWVVIRNKFSAIFNNLLKRFLKNIVRGILHGGFCPRDRESNRGKPYQFHSLLRRLGSVLHVSACVEQFLSLQKVCLLGKYLKVLAQDLGIFKRCHEFLFLSPL